MDKSFDPKSVEQRIYQHWEKANYFAPDGKGEPYTIMLPPPNVTGSLHMGHAFQDTLMDTLTRYHRMSGKNTLWQAGTDHAGIATQMVVERMLANDGISRHDLGREAFNERVWDWKKKSGGTITQQLRRLGSSLDWQHERFTLDPELSQTVCKVFVDLYREGLIYRGKRLVNWDPKLHTAVSDLEVISSEESGHMWHIKYPLADGKNHLIVATTRPETLLGDSAVAVHPDDERYQHLIGTYVLLPLCDRRIPIIADTYVDPAFGSGCVKITPAHDFNDYDVGQRHNLPLINIFTDSATLNNHAPAAYQGMDRYACRKQLLMDLEATGLLEKTEPHTLMIPRGDRSGVVIEPYLTDQWYVKTQPLADPAIEAVKSGRIRFVPENWNKTYFEWMDNIQDWCISRQLWWGHRIPAWYDADGKHYVGFNEAEVRSFYKLDDAVELKQDDDVLDTWFSSALWPFSTLGWPEKTERFNAFYPGSVLVTGFDIIFFWVARMIMMGLKFTGDIPFKEVYVHALVRDGQGQKMSKSKGNVLDPLDIIDGISLEDLRLKRSQGLMQPEMKPAIDQATRDEFPDGIKAFGTDALRFTFAALATTGRDIRLDLGRIDGYRNFCNKLWNASRYVLMNCEESELGEKQAPQNPINRWIVSQLHKTIQEITGHFEHYRFDLIAHSLYEFTWNEYCDWYLELTKPILLGDSEALKTETRRTLLEVLETLLRTIHPIMPFISEEIWQRVKHPLSIDADTIMLQPYPLCDSANTDSEADDDIAWIKSFLLGIRQIRGEMNIDPKKRLTALIHNAKPSDQQRLQNYRIYLLKLGSLDAINPVEDLTEKHATALLGDMQIMIPIKGLIDPQAEIVRLTKELQKQKKEFQRSDGKLKNRKFLDNAPTSVVEQEKDRLASRSKIIEKIRAQIQDLEQE